MDVGIPAKLAVAGRWQWTNRHLPAGQQISLSAPGAAIANTGLLPHSYFADNLTELAGQLRVDLPLGEAWMFVAASYGEEYRQQFDQWYQLTAAGLGWQAELLRNEYGALRAKLSVGHPLAHKSNGVFHDDGVLRVDV